MLCRKQEHFRGHSLKQRPLIRTLCLWLAAACCPWSGGLAQQQDVGALITSGQHTVAAALLEQQLGAGQYAAAEPALERLVRDQPAVGRYKYLLGYCYARRFRYADAERVLREAVAGDPQQHTWLHLLAKCLLEQNQNRAAVGFLDQAIAIAPDPEYYFAKAMCLMNMGRLDEAEIALRQCIGERPRHAEALYKLGTITADRGNYAESRDVLRRSIAANPDQLDARFRLGLAESRGDDLAAAVVEFEAVLAKIPGHVGALYNLGRVLARQGRHEEGRRRLEDFKAMSELEDRIQFHREFVKKDPASVEKRMALTDYLAQAGRLDEAVVELEAARALDPLRPLTYRGLAKLFLHLGREQDRQRAVAFAEELERRGK